MSRLVQARFSGRCPVCEDWWDVGDDIRYGSYEEAMVHDWCASDIDREDEE